MRVHSSGILLFRFREGRLEVLLVHPGGPFWERKDKGSWSIPKGLSEEGESPLDAAKREFQEETGIAVDGEFIDLDEISQSGKKAVHIWALEKDLDETRIVSNKFFIEWPRRSGMVREYPEIDRAGWFEAGPAKEKISRGQAGFIDRLMDAIGYTATDAGLFSAHHQSQS